MLQIIIKSIVKFCGQKNRWWVPLLTGFTFALALPPFDHEFHWIFSIFPFFSFIILIPLFFFAVINPFRRAFLYTYLYGFSASLSQYYWLINDTAEGLWHLIILGLFLIAGVIGLLYLTAGMLFRLSRIYFGRAYIVLFPALWVCIDFLRTLWDISFPWALLGYSFTSVLPIAQIATVTGVWGITYLVIFGNILNWELLTSYYEGENRMQKVLHILLFSCLIGGCAIWGTLNMKNGSIDGDVAKVALIQSNIDQFNWGNKSLDTAFNITEEMLFKAAENRPDILVAPESALLCYLAQRPDLSRRVRTWVDSMQIPVLLGALDWQKSPLDANYDYYVYNTAFFIKPGKAQMEHYYKNKLVPFSEVMPFEGIFPILSRVNLGEADFQRGNDSVIFDVNSKVKAAPFICYEIIYPGYVQERLKKGANLITAITNDGWFGKSSGPYHHAAMARMRAIENRVSLIRCANSGISMITDPYGRIQKSSGLYTREIIEDTVLLRKPDTFYSHYGDWVVKVCAILGIVTLIIIFIRFSTDKISKKRQGSSAGKTAEAPKTDLVSTCN